MKEKRTDGYSISADVIRIISAFFVVFSHSTDVFILWAPFIGSFSWNAIYYLNTLSRVAVPMFVILSGYLVLRSEKTQNLTNYYKKRFSRIGIPFVFWIIVYFLWGVYWDHDHITMQFVTRRFLTADIKHLYFLFIILELYLIGPFIVRYTETLNREKQTILFWSLNIFSVFCAVLANLPGVHIDLAKSVFTIFIPYLGYFYAGAYLRSVKVSKIKAMIFGFVYFILAIVTNLIAKGNTSAFVVYNYSLTLLPMSLCFFLALKNIDQFSSKKFHGERFKTFIINISALTFGIYLLHFIVLELVKKYFHLSPWELHAPLLLFAMFSSILTFFITLTLVWGARKIPGIKYLCG